MPELVSILVPAYNAQRWIGDAIESALGQTWPKKEIIIVDDGSSDNTFQVARRFESKVVKVITQENRGGSAARNRALRLAQGDFIQWLDADDRLAPEKISRQIEGMDGNRNPEILLTSRYGKFYYRREKARFIDNSLCEDLDPREWLIRKFMDKVSLTTNAFLVSRRLTEAAGLWNERLSFDDDGEYFTRVVSISRRIRYIPEAISYYRVVNRRSLSNDRSDRAVWSLLLSIELCIRHLQSLENSEETRKASIKYLENYAHYFYPRKQQIWERAKSIGRNLGKELTPPKFGLKFRIAEAMLGLDLASRLKNEVWGAELFVRRNVDRALHLFGKRRY